MIAVMRKKAIVKMDLIKNKRKKRPLIVHLNNKFQHRIRLCLMFQRSLLPTRKSGKKTIVLKMISYLKLPKSSDLQKRNKECTLLTVMITRQEKQELSPRKM